MQTHTYHRTVRWTPRPRRPCAPRLGGSTCKLHVVVMFKVWGGADWWGGEIVDSRHKKWSAIHVNAVNTLNAGYDGTLKADGLPQAVVCSASGHS